MRVIPQLVSAPLNPIPIAEQTLAEFSPFLSTRAFLDMSPKKY